MLDEDHRRRWLTGCQTYENRNKELKDQWRAEKAVYESGKAEASGLPVSYAVSSTPVATHQLYFRLQPTLPLALSFLSLQSPRPFSPLLPQRLFPLPLRRPRMTLRMKSPQLKRTKIPHRIQAPMTRLHLHRRSRRRRPL